MQCRVDDNVSHFSVVLAQCNKTGQGALIMPHGTKCT